MFIPDPDLDFLSIPDPGVKKAPDPGYRIRIFNTVLYYNIPVHIYFRPEHNPLALTTGVVIIGEPYVRL
jgi:hypothetical protein